MEVTIRMDSSAAPAEEHLPLNIADDEHPANSPSDISSPVDRLSPVLVVFCVFAARLFLPFSWSSDFIPVVSPVYRQQETWGMTAWLKQALLWHVGSGIVSYACILIQFDASLRHARPWLHRLSGRVYVTAGCTCVLTLRMLRDTSGAGSNPNHEGDYMMSWFIDAASICWFGATAVALYCVIVNKDHEAHARWMTRSVAVMLVPIPQRGISFVALTPIAMVMRLIVSVIYFTELPWEARWGPPGTAWSLMLGVPSSTTTHRESPLVLSFDGFGEGEQCSFWVSAWSGLFVVVAVCEQVLTVHDGAAQRAKLSLAWRRARSRAKMIAAYVMNIGNKAAIGGMLVVTGLGILSYANLLPAATVAHSVAILMGWLVLAQTYVPIIGFGSIALVIPIWCGMKTYAAGYGIGLSLALCGGSVGCFGVLGAMLVYGYFKSIFYLYRINHVDPIQQPPIMCLFHVLTFGLVFGDRDADQIEPLQTDCL